MILEYKLEANREEYGTRGTPLVMGLGAAIDFINAIGVRRIQERGMKMASSLKQELLKIPNVDILTPLEPKYSAAIVTFEVKGKKYGEVQQLLQDEHKCRVRGIFEHGLNAVRVSCALYNTHEELEKLVHGVNQIARS